MTKTFAFSTNDNKEIITYIWEPDEVEKAKGVVQIVHGSVEHALRYDAFANELSSNGFIVYANDQRGHGKTARTADDLGYFSHEENGWELAVDDLYYITTRIKENYPTLPIYLFGHSMGSFLVRDYASTYGDIINGFILSGTGTGSLFMPILKFMAKKEINKNGSKSRNTKLHNLVYGSLNNKIKNAKTSSDFISRDMVEVEKYINDPFCGYTCTAEYIHEMLKGAIKVNKSKYFKTTPNNLKIYILSGEKDPVGGINGNGVLKVYNSYVKSGIKDIDFKLYSDARHEILNELNREEVITDIVKWLNEKST